MSGGPVSGQQMEQPGQPCTQRGQPGLNFGVADVPAAASFLFFCPEFPPQTDGSAPPSSEKDEKDQRLQQKFEHLSYGSG